MNRLLSRVMGVEDRAAQIVHPANVPSDALSMRWGYRGQPMYPRQNPDAAVEWGYLANLYAYRCVNTIASTICGLPFRGAAEADADPDLKSALAQLLGPAPGGPNTYWSSALLWKYAIASWLIQGKWAWLKQYDGSDLVGLFPLQAQGLVPVPATSGNSPWDHFEYLRGTPYFTTFAPDEVFYAWNPSQQDWRMPESVLSPAARTVNMQKLLEDFDTSFLTNGGVPAYLVTTEAFAQSDDRKRFRKQFERFQGAANAGSVMFAERVYDPGETTGTPPDPVKVETIGINQRDAQLAALRDTKVRDLCVAFGVPLSLLGDSSLTRFHQTAEDRQMYYTETISPLIRALSDQVNIGLGAELSEFGWFDVKSIRELAHTRVFTNDAMAIQLVVSQMITLDEWRDDAGLPSAQRVGLSGIVVPPAVLRETEQLRLAVPQGGAVSQVGSETSKTEGEAPTATPPATPAAAPARAPAGARELPPGVVDLRAIAAARREPLALEARHPGPDGHSPGIPSGHVTKTTLEQALTTRLRRFLGQQVDTTSRRLGGRRNRTVRAAMVRNVEALFDVGYWQSEGAKLFPEHTEIINRAVLETAADLADAVRVGASDDELLAVFERAIHHYRLPAA